MPVLRPILALVVVFLLARSSPAQFTGTKIVETGVSYPGIGTFNTFPSGPSISGSTIAFPAATGTGPGIFTATSGTVTAVATLATPVPGGTGTNFTTFAGSATGLSSSGVAFGGNGSPGPGNAGVYTTVTGSLTTVVNNITAYPTGGTFTGFSVPAVSGTTVAFGGTNSGPGTALGIFSKTGTGPLNIIANTSTAVPFGSGNFTSFSDPFNGPTLPNISGSNVVFNGQGGGRIGVYTTISGSVTRVADTTMTPPGGIGAFSSFSTTPSIDGSQVAFSAPSAGSRVGVYTWSGGTLALVADTTTSAPGGGTFNNFNMAVALSGGRVVFRATNTLGQDGIYTNLTGTLTKVVATGDVIDGHTITALTMSDFAFAGGDIAVAVAYSGGSAIYTFHPVPEPTGLIALGAAGVVAVRVWRRTRAARSVL
jgi:hypothetical protein